MITTTLLLHIAFAAILQGGYTNPPAGSYKIKVLTAPDPGIKGPWTITHSPNGSTLETPTGSGLPPTLDWNPVTRRYEDPQGKWTIRWIWDIQDKEPPKLFWIASRKKADGTYERVRGIGY